jgi:hypothetical protein
MLARVARKKKRLPKDFGALLRSGDLDAAAGCSRNSGEELLYRLSELAVLWVLANPDPLPSPEPAYTR